MPDVSLDNAVWLLTGLAAVVILLTRMRLSSEQSQAGHALVPHAVVNAHSIVGVGALGVWIAYLTSPGGTLGATALGLWWIEVALGILILLRWMSGSGRHATATTGDSWGEGPSLSILGHVGMLLGVGFFTWVVLAEKISG
ncbi:hypothetical protein ASE01_02330 [Nocardioides sp. Root190]|uniref:hypothetical protein n=1 Tax=Nocardioides sp. Root190 TaxID=1736488 RepID=UPI0006F8AF7E|nr:hypothetical protein [Nocardioides sp. Root190]KRB80343.1 hypothetical protein ASE01_02330 [Nocardioides sp. Root190]